MKISAGLLMYHCSTVNELNFFLSHPGGPFFKNKDLGSWTIPKGEPYPDEEFLSAAIREFKEETGIDPNPPYLELGQVKQAGGKVVHAWAFKTESPSIPAIISNNFEMEWPPKSGKKATFLEIDKAAFFPLREAILKINPAQKDFITRLSELLK